MDVVLLHNSGAGDEDHTEKKLLRLLKRHGYKATYAPVEEGLEDTALLKRAEIVIAAGGDGTVRKAVTRLAGRKRPVAILPLGTANNIARSLGIGTNVNRVVAGWKTAQTRPIDLGIAKGPWGRTTFIEGIGFGLISRTIAILDALDEHVTYEFPAAEAKLHRDICVLAALTHEMPPVKARVRTNDERIKDDFLLLEILNISRAGPGVVLARDADPGDGWLNVVSVVAEEREKLLERFERHAGGRKGIRLHETATKRIKLVVDPCELRIDDKIALTPSDFKDLPDQRAEIDVRIEPGAVQMLCGPCE
jgi:Sphingosine kinase and enzymes related to eukaryotic diacylglycerol kinase